MAIRPVFVAIDNPMLVDTYIIEFKWYSGMTLSQKQKCTDSLHHAFVQKRPDLKVLEVSSKSKVPLGVKLSAFHLVINDKLRGKAYSVEMLYQASKVFEYGGPYMDLLDGTSFKAKKDSRLTSSGNLVGFVLDDELLQCYNYPQNFFYNWIYINALTKYPELIEQIVKYDAFTDIVFNPAKAYCCQAQACAILVALVKRKQLEEALKSKDEFLKIVYPGFEPVTGGD